MNARTQFLLDNPAIVRKIYSKYMYLVMDFEEFFQEVIEKSLCRTYAYDPAKASICTYSTRFVQLIALQLFRNYLMHLPDSSPSRETVATLNHDIRHFENADMCQHILTLLDGRDRRFAELMLDGLSVKEIAGVFGISKQRTHQIFAKIRKKIKKAI